MKNMIATMSRKRTTYYQSKRNYCANGLAITPSDMNRSAELGVPISSQQLNPDMFDDGNLSNCCDIDPLYLRGMNVNHLWESSQTSKKKLQQSHKRFKNSL